MAHSKNSVVQKLMDEVEALSGAEADIEEKLKQIAAAVAAEQAKTKPQSSTRTDVPVDPADAFACEGCQ